MRGISRCQIMTALDGSALSWLAGRDEFALYNSWYPDIIVL